MFLMMPSSFSLLSLFLLRVFNSASSEGSTFWIELVLMWRRRTRRRRKK
jgi:hypothetical protein